MVSLVAANILLLCKSNFLHPLRPSWIPFCMWEPGSCRSQPPTPNLPGLPTGRSLADPTPSFPCSPSLPPVHASVLNSTIRRLLCCQWEVALTSCCVPGPGAQLALACPYAEKTAGKVLELGPADHRGNGCLVLACSLADNCSRGPDCQPCGDNAITWQVIADVSVFLPEKLGGQRGNTKQFLCPLNCRRSGGRAVADSRLMLLPLPTVQVLI